MAFIAILHWRQYYQLFNWKRLNPLVPFSEIEGSSGTAPTFQSKVSGKGILTSMVAQKA